MVRRRTSLLYGSSGTDEDSLDVPSIEEECRFLGSLRWCFGDFSFRRCTRYEVSLSCRSQRLMILADVFMTCSGDTHSRLPAFLSISQPFFCSRFAYTLYLSVLLIPLLCSCYRNTTLSFSGDRRRERSSSLDIAIRKTRLLLISSSSERKQRLRLQQGGIQGDKRKREFALWAECSGSEESCESINRFSMVVVETPATDLPLKLSSPVEAVYME